MISIFFLRLENIGSSDWNDNPERTEIIFPWGSTWAIIMIGSGSSMSIFLNNIILNCQPESVALISARRRVQHTRVR